MHTEKTASLPMDTVDALIASLNDPSKPVVRKAADGLIACLEKFPELPDKLEALLGSAAKQSQWPLAYVLGHLARPPALSIEVLLDNLGNSDPDIRWALLLLLARLAQRHSEVIKKLVDLVQSGDQTQRRMAIYCLREVPFERGATIAALSRACDDPAATVRVAAVTCLRSFPELTEPTAARLLRLLASDPDVRVRCAAAAILGQIRPTTVEVRDALRDAAASPHPQLKKAAEAALNVIQKVRPVPAGR